MQEKLEMKRVCAYARVSTKAEKQEGSLVSQINYYNDFINSIPNYINMGVYAERKSGANQKKRSQFLEMIKQCKSRNIDIIYTKTVARFGRNARQLLQTIEDLTKIGVQIIFEVDDIDTFRDKQNIKTIIKSYFAEDELEKDSIATKFGILRRMEQGKVVIPNPNPLLGYRYDEDRKLILVPEDAKIVKEIFDRYINGDKPSDIIRSLNARGIKTSGGKEWNYCNLAHILKQEKYTGDAYLQKYYSDSRGQRINRGEKAMYVVERWCEPIITHEQFEKAKVIRQSRMVYDRKPGHIPRYDIFRGIIRCGQCGSNYNKQGFGHKTLKHGNKQKETYDCQKRKMHGVHACHNRIQDRLTLEDAFIKAFNTMKSMVGKQEKKALKNEEIEQIDIKIKELLNKEKIYLQMEVRGLLTEEFEQKHQELITKVMKLEDRKKEIYKYNIDIREQSSYIDKFNEVFNRYDKLEKFNEEICKLMLEEIIVMNRNKLIYKFRNGYQANIEVIDYQLERDEIGEVEIYAISA